MWDTVKNLISAAAPVIGTALGGPLGGAAGGIISKLLLGDEAASATPKDLEVALKSAGPEQWAAIKKADQAFKQKLAEIGLDEKKLEQLDRDSARQREVELAKAGKRDLTTPVLACLVTVGFFGLLSGLLFISVDIPMRSLLDAMVGSLGTAWIMIISYYFGSSFGSRQKDDRNKSR